MFVLFLAMPQSFQVLGSLTRDEPLAMVVKVLSLNCWTTKEFLRPLVLRGLGHIRTVTLFHLSRYYCRNRKQTIEIKEVKDIILTFRKYDFFGIRGAWLKK